MHRTFISENSWGTRQTKSSIFGWSANWLSAQRYKRHPHILKLLDNKRKKEKNLKISPPSIICCFNVFFEVTCHRSETKFNTLHSGASVFCKYHQLYLNLGKLWYINQCMVNVYNRVGSFEYYWYLVLFIGRSLRLCL